jgi:HD-GYP domain-containing protein (c-di-GMP phosphodiesterase class II)
MSTGVSQTIKNNTVTKTITRYPLQLEIATVFTVLITVLGLSLVWYNFQENKKITLIAADDMFERTAQLTASNIQELYRPAEALVALSAKLEISESTAIHQRQNLLNYFFESLRLAKHISSIYVGYENGELFLVRAIRNDDAIRQSLGAPPQAEFAINNISLSKGKPLQTYFYYAENGTLIGNSEPQNTDFDPRQRRWYQLAVETSKQITSGFYVFHSTHVVGTTIAQRTANGNAVIGADITLSELSTGFTAQKTTPSSMIFAFNSEGVLVASNKEMQVAQSSTAQAQGNSLQQIHLNQLGNRIVDRFYDIFRSGMKEGQLAFTVANQTWMGVITPLHIRSGREIYLTVLAPQNELLAGIIAVRNHSVLISLGLLLLAIFAAWSIARRMSQSLRALASEAENIREFKLDTPFSLRSRIIEVDDLSTTMAVMKSSIQQFIEISKSLSAEKNFDRLLENILMEARNVCNADGGAILLYDDETQVANVSFAYNKPIDLYCGGTSKTDVPFAEISLPNNQETNLIEHHVVLNGTTVVIDDATQDMRFDYRYLRERYDRGDYRCRSLLSLPLRNRLGEIIGALELVNARNKNDDSIIEFKPEIVSYVEALSSQAAIALDNRRLLKAQKDLMDSFIQLIAGAIDAKSPYTSGHCQRVPELARMLAEAAHHSETEPFKSFRLSDDEWYELHIASWLHDCGKVTTPEYVVDKATKLECIYNRLHEIRMRFEVLWRDTQIAHFRKLAGNMSGNENDKLAVKLEQLQEDYAFVAECNVGGEFMSPEEIERLQRLGSQTWLRHFDDRIGLSYEELARKQRESAKSLPMEETLLSDKPEHIVPRGDNGQPFGDNPYGFRMDVPENAFNYGELYNLSVARGTLTAEDRFKINEHIVQTIILLNKLPFPKELRRVPTWAGNHHETLVGSGYPRKLQAADLSVPERIMAIADIFEALTASDRPYKKAKTLSESLRIMSFMRNDGHICPQLFDLFLSSGIYWDYAQQFLSPAQIDNVDISQFMSVTTV